MMTLERVKAILAEYEKKSDVENGVVTEYDEPSLSDTNKKNNTTARAIKPIQTEYKGYKFRSRLEARWAVFFDACGVEWEYEPEGFDLGDGIRYLPDFLLHNVYLNPERGKKEDLWVEVKGNMTIKDSLKIEKFAGTPEDRDDLDRDDLLDRWWQRVKNPIVVVSNIPDCSNWTSFIIGHNYHNYCGVNEIFGSYKFIFQNYFTELHIILALDYEGSFVLAPLKDLGNPNLIDRNSTLAAYKKAKQARFEYNETPLPPVMPVPVDTVELLIACDDHYMGNTPDFYRALSLTTTDALIEADEADDFHDRAFKKGKSTYTQEEIKHWHSTEAELLAQIITICISRLSNIGYDKKARQELFKAINVENKAKGYCVKE